MSKKSKTIKLKIKISNLRGKALEGRIDDYIKGNQKVFCKGLNKRPIFIDEYLYFINSRNSPDKNHRRMSFFPAIELIKNVKKENITNTKCVGGKFSYEFKGITPKGNIVGVHILEFSNKKDKKLKLISTFWDK